MWLNEPNPMRSLRESGKWGLINISLCFAVPRKARAVIWHIMLKKPCLSRIVMQNSPVKTESTKVCITTTHLLSVSDVDL